VRSVGNAWKSNPPDSAIVVCNLLSPPQNQFIDFRKLANKKGPIKKFQDRLTTIIAYYNKAIPQRLIENKD
jgi:hypothetical protein